MRKVLVSTLGLGFAAVLGLIVCLRGAEAADGHAAYQGVDASQRNEEALSAEFGTLSLGAVEYHIAHGEFSTEDIGGFVRYRPIGNSHHVIEFGGLDGEEQVREWSIAPGGEFFLSGHAIVVDFHEQGRIEFGTSSESDSPSCDGTYTDVRSATTDGGCWSPPVVDVDTGLVTHKCNLDNDMKCTAIITYMDSTPPVTPEWECSQKNNRKLQFNPNTKVASVLNAASGC